MAKIKMKNSVTVAETFHDFLVGKKAAGGQRENPTHLRATLFGGQQAPFP